MSGEYKQSSLKAIVGLGNPGARFDRTRHNIGFRIVDALAECFGAQFKSVGEYAYAEIFVPLAGSQDTQRLILLKPLTFMNDSGKAMPFLTRKNISPSEILVIHDELEKKFGSLSIRLGGSARGHNGLRSIIEAIGAEFWRLRFGIDRPEDKEDVPHYVLARFFPTEEAEMDEKIDNAINAILNKK